jgi:hypothetical protein
MKYFTMIAFVSILCAGCGAKPAAKKPVVVDRVPEMSSAWQTTPLPARAEPTAVKAGAAPLVYRVEGGATIRVQEEESKRDLARGYVPAGSIVRVDARRGVIYGEDTVFAGPMPEGGRYVIYVEPGGENVARQGVIRPRPHDAR